MSSFLHRRQTTTQSKKSILHLDHSQTHLVHRSSPSTKDDLCFRYNAEQGETPPIFLLLNHQKQRFPTHHLSISFYSQFLSVSTTTTSLSSLELQLIRASLIPLDAFLRSFRFSCMLQDVVGRSTIDGFSSCLSLEPGLKLSWLGTIRRSQLLNVFGSWIKRRGPRRSVALAVDMMCSVS